MCKVFPKLRRRRSRHNNGTSVVLPNKGMLLTCALSFIISSIPLAIIVFKYNPHISEYHLDRFLITPGIISNRDEVQVVTDRFTQLIQKRESAAEETRIILQRELQKLHEETSNLRQQLAEANKNFRIENDECSTKLKMAEHGFEESYRRFEIVQGFFDQCKNTTVKMSQILVEASEEITNCTKQLNNCAIQKDDMKRLLLLHENEEEEEEHGKIQGDNTS